MFLQLIPPITYYSFHPQSLKWITQNESKDLPFEREVLKIKKNEKTTGRAQDISRLPFFAGGGVIGALSTQLTTQDSCRQIDVQKIDKVGQRLECLRGYPSLSKNIKSPKTSL